MSPDEPLDRYVEYLRSCWGSEQARSLKAAVDSKDFDEAARILKQMASERRRNKKGELA